jgi:hypothetical protein
MMISQEERISRLEGIIEQINERLAAIERNVSMIMDRKADKTEVRFLFGITITLIGVNMGLVGGLIGAVLSKL